MFGRPPRPGPAAETLRVLLDDPSPTVRLRAATAILDATLKARAASVLRRRELRLRAKLKLPADQAQGSSDRQGDGGSPYDYGRLDREELRDLECLNDRFESPDPLTADEAVRFFGLLRKALIRPRRRRS
jgi:hypothetical protein